MDGTDILVSLSSLATFSHYWRTHEDKYVVQSSEVAALSGAYSCFRFVGLGFWCVLCCGYSCAPSFPIACVCIAEFSFTFVLPSVQEQQREKRW